MLQCGMAMFGTLRGWSAVLRAMFLAFAIMIPTIDTCICSLDEDQAAFNTKVSVGDTNKVPSQPRHAGDVSCNHGHCHHWVGVAKVSERPAFELTLTNGELPQGLYRSPPSAPQNELLRPPQA